MRDPMAEFADAAEACRAWRDTVRRFPALLKRLRRALGLGQKPLAAALGVHFTFLSHIENGRKPVSADLIDRLERLLKKR
jgi:ribosome-binding protein aMBF1 (putative translation factor)